MLTYIIRRVLYSIPVLILSSFLSFMFVSFAGDPLGKLRANPQLSQVTVANLTHQYHLDVSIPLRYRYWVHDLFTTSSAPRSSRCSRSGRTSRARSATRRS